MFSRLFTRPSQLFVPALCVAALSSCQNPEATPDLRGPPVRREVSAPVNTGYAVGDMLDVFVMEDEKFNGSYKVRENGDIILPKVGRVQVGGMSASGAQDAIASVLMASQLQKATVIVDRAARNNVQTFAEKPKMLIYVAGSVNQPGQHMIALANGSGVSAYEAILIAGGTSNFADERRAYILRRGAGNSRTRIPLNIKDIRDGNGPDVPLREGDLITVPERKFGLNL